MQAILKNNVTNVTLDHNTILEKDLLDDKAGILDIKAKIDNKMNVNIEMQVVDQHNIEKRILYYWSKMYTQNLKSGKNYNQLEKSISILFIDFNLKNLENIEKYLTKWNIREEKYTDLILTDDLELYIISLPKYKEQKNKNQNELDLWLEFIEKPEVILKMKDTNKEIKKAGKVLEEISQDERERYLAELREKYIMDQKAIEDGGFYKGLEQGINKGIKQGIRQGIKQGKEESTFDIAKKMKNKGIDIDTIKEITGLTREKIEQI